MIEGTFNCLIDRERTEALASATRNIVKPDDVVVDAGTATRILAMATVSAGARRVYAVESEKRNAAALKATFRANGFGDRIAVIDDDARNVTLPKMVHVIICEMTATGRSVRPQTS
jgi:predicted RNA methylase